MDLTACTLLWSTMKALTDLCSACLQIVQISSALGSIGILQKQLASPEPPFAVMSRNVLAYRASKSALNMGAHSWYQLPGVTPAFGLLLAASPFRHAHRALRPCKHGCAETVSLAVDLKSEGITVVSMSPGWVSRDHCPFHFSSGSEVV